MSGKCCVGHKIAMALVIIGALNWGLVGAFGFNLVEAILGSMPMIERIVYVLVGLAGIVMIFGCRCKKCKEACGMDGKKMMGGDMKKM